MDDEHPLLLELADLRRTAARFQHEAHESAIKLQQHVRKTSRVHEHAASLDHENTRLHEELAFLRSNPDVAPHSTVVHVQELTLALRRLSEKISLTESALFERTHELVSARTELAKARHDADGAYELASRMRAREEECKQRERGLEIKARASEEQRKMVDLVVQDYADLVRSLEGRRSVHHDISSPRFHESVSTATLSKNMQDAKSQLQKLLADFSDETNTREATITDLRGQVSMLQLALEAERKASLHDRALLSQAQTELSKLNLEDQTAAKMVSRYMKFSQSSINSLQQQIDTIKARHASTVSTFQLQLSHSESLLTSERAQSARLQDTLDVLCEDVVREAYGRRREVAFRLALLSREESLAEGIKRLARRARELYERCYPESDQTDDDVGHPPSTPSSSTDVDVRTAFRRVVYATESILHSLHADVISSDGIEVSGSLTRILLARDAVEALRDELQAELGKRIEAIRRYEELTSRTPDGFAREISQTVERANGALEHEYEERGEHPTDSNGTIQDSHALLSPVLTPQEVIDEDPFKVPSGLSNGSIDLITPSSPPSSAQIRLLDQAAAVAQPIHPSPSALQDDRLLKSPPQPLIDEELTSAQEHPPATSRLEPVEMPMTPVSEEPTRYMTPRDEVNVLDGAVANAASTPTEDSAGTHDIQNFTLNSIPGPASPPTPSSFTLPTNFQERQSNEDSALLSSLGATKHRYDTLQREFRDCSVALKELKRTLTAPSSPPKQKYQHLQAALLRVDDYAEDARVELEIRIADEELTARGFETLLSVPGALDSPEHQAEVEENARKFVDGTDEGVSRAMEKFEKKLDDVQHDVAVIKRVVHELPLQPADDNKGIGWSSWTKGLLGTGSSPSRSTTPVLTFGSVMTSPRLRRESSFRQLHSPGPEGHEDPRAGSGPLLADLDLRIPMPSPATTSYASLGIGRAPESRPRTISTMYSVGLGGRSSSLALGIGLGSSPSPPSRNQVSRPSLSRFASASLVGDSAGEKDTRDDVYDDSDVE